jgi:hypothetical protein
LVRAIFHVEPQCTKCAGAVLREIVGNSVILDEGEGAEVEYFRPNGGNA